MKTMLVSSEYSSKNFSSRVGCKPEWIVLHSPNSVLSARKQAKYFTYSSKYRSTHYVIGPCVVYNLVPVRECSWHTSTSHLANPLCTNHNSIGVGLEVRKEGKSIPCDGALGWYLEDEVLENLISTLVSLCKMHDIAPERVVRQYDVTGIPSPLVLCSGVVQREGGVSGDQVWSSIKLRLIGELDHEHPD